MLIWTSGAIFTLHKRLLNSLHLQSPSWLRKNQNFFFWCWKVQNMCKFNFSTFVFHRSVNMFPPLPPLNRPSASPLLCRRLASHLRLTGPVLPVVLRRLGPNHQSALGRGLARSGLLHHGCRWGPKTLSAGAGRASRRWLCAVPACRWRQRSRRHARRRVRRHGRQLPAAASGPSDLAAAQPAPAASAASPLPAATVSAVPTTTTGRVAILVLLSLHCSAECCYGSIFTSH